MIYFFKSSRKNELFHPVTICANSEKRAVALAVINFVKHGLKGSPQIIAL